MEETGGQNFSYFIKLHDKIIFTNQDVTYKDVRMRACIQHVGLCKQYTGSPASPPTVCIDRHGL